MIGASSQQAAALIIDISNIRANIYADFQRGNT